jgi:23S rRNA (cytidine1920-2'-O)/16S rRNA (cytidine1409-2'-O)-methyltransferase
VNGAPAAKAAHLVSPAEPVTLSGPPPRFVSRGGDKLDAALERFAVDVAGKRALDAGASTGGFTDCLLQRGARQVVAVDVGYGQLDSRIRADRRVTMLERTNVRTVTIADVGGRPFPLVVADLSFISLTTVAPVLAGDLAAAGADLVLLVKPQFEAGVREASRGRGVIRDPAVWHRALQEVGTALNRAGAAMMGLMVSPLTGASGNVEFLGHFRAHARPGRAPGAEDAQDAQDAAAIVAVVEEASGR